MVAENISKQRQTFNEQQKTFLEARYIHNMHTIDEKLFAVATFEGL